MGESTVPSDGNLVPTFMDDSKSFWVTYSNLSGVEAAGKIIIDNNTNMVHMSLANRYPSLPENYKYIAPVGVNIHVYDSSNNIDTGFNEEVRVRALYGSAVQTLNVQVTNGESSTKYFYIPLDNEEIDRTVRIIILTEGRTFIAETALLKNGKEYYAAIEPTNIITVSKGSVVQTCNVKLTEAKEDEQEQEEEKKQDTHIHSWGSWITIKEPTYTSEGIAIRVCKGDSSHIETKYIAILNKASQPMNVKVRKPSVKYSKLTKKKQTIKAGKAFIVKDAQGAVTYKKMAGNKKISVASNGTITLKKGLKKGTYKIKVEVLASGNDVYNAGSKSVKLKIKVK